MRNNSHTISNMDDLLNLPDISGMVQELREEKPEPRQKDKSGENNPTTGNPLWQLFLKNAERYLSLIHI